MNSFEKLQKKLAELFQLDQADLDFGIYRIMNARRDEITRFLEKDLLPQVRDAFNEYKSSDKAELQKELKKVIEGVNAADMDPDTSPKVKELKSKLESEAVDVTSLENEVYNHLCSFFSRYYDDGDFISLRRYKEGVYAIPYEGEEVKLHWANSDQYYVKTSEYFKDYSFKLSGDKKVHFKIIEADTEKDNIKVSNGKDRRFLLFKDNPVEEIEGELNIRFEYSLDESKRKQDHINADSSEKIISELNSDEYAIWQHKLSAKWKRADGSESDKTVLEKHLYDYTRRNTFDYFIHKDLGGFFRRELDFYIKNEVMRLDDIENEIAPRVEQYLSKIKVIRKIAYKIIDFLSQIEDFQKKLWLKKKFVIETNYCITLDRIPEELYEEIAANDAQMKEWVKLFSIDEITVDTLNQNGMFEEGAKAVAYSNPLTIEFLKRNQYLSVDTSLFDAQFKDKLIAKYDDFNDNLDGLLIHSENFQGLSLIREWAAKSINCVYIDPPYNTSENTFIYKNEYKHSSWITMMANRIALSKEMIAKNGVIEAAIDDTETPLLRLLLDESFSNLNRVATIAIEVNPAGQNLRPNVPALSHDYCHIYARNIDKMEMILRGLTEDEKKIYRERDKEGFYLWDNLRRRGGNSRPSDRPKQWFPLYVDSITKKVSVNPFEGAEEIWPIDPKGEKRIWRVNIDGAKREINAGEISVLEKAGRLEIVKKTHMPEGKKPKTLWKDSKYSATTHGTKLLIDILGEQSFSYPKSLYLVKDCLQHWADENSISLDYFAGSGTTAHAVIELNRNDGGSRKYVLIEMGDHFEKVLKPRIRKAVYSKDWKNGKPVSREGISHMLKYVKLESYEDTLANIEMHRTEDQDAFLGQTDRFRESYMLSYMLDVESRGSKSLLSVDDFDDPFNYALEIGTGSVGETKSVKVDLIETFNWMLGLKVKHMDCIQDLRIVEGTDPKDQRILIIWRKIRDLKEDTPEKIQAAREKANSELEEFFRKQKYNTLDIEYDLIYVNGDNNLMNLPLIPEKEGIRPRYKVRLIEEEFKRLMFDVKDV